MAAVRSASREPTAERLAYTRDSRHDSFSSDSSSATVFSDGFDDQQGAPSKPIPNLASLGLAAGTQSTTVQTGGAGGYYSSLASEYRQIAKDVENQAFYAADGPDSKDYKKAVKDRLKETYQEPQTMVPHPTDLYG
jgi:hypothetical protein